jgi:hypothetical protein
MPRALSFQARYVDAVLDGSKPCTVRRMSARLPVVGDRVTLTRGRGPAFARATVAAVEPFRRVDAERWAWLCGHESGVAMRAALRELYGARARLAVIVLGDVEAVPSAPTPVRSITMSRSASCSIAPTTTGTTASARPASAERG